MKLRSPGILLALSLALSSCSVLEDRSSCPVTILLHLDRVSLFPIHWLMRPADGSGQVVSGTVIREECRSGLVVSVPRNEWDMLICHAGGSAFISEEGLRVNEGAEYPILESASLRIVPGDGEYVEDTLRLHKNYATAYLYLKDVYSSDLEYEICGEVCGCAPDGTPLSGPYRCLLSPDEAHLASVRLPRQRAGDELRLNIYSAGMEGKRTLVRSFSLGGVIEGSGYDWGAEDLEDFAMEIDYTRTTVFFSVEEWKKTLSFDISL